MQSSLTLLLNFYTENASVRFEFSEEACNVVLWRCSCYKGQLFRTEKSAEGKATLLLPSLLFWPFPAQALCRTYHKDLGFSKHLQVFISIERFIGLPCNSCCTFAFLTSGAGMVYSVQSSWFTSYQRIMYVLYLYSVVAKVTFIYCVQIRMWWCYQGHEYIFTSRGRVLA